MGEHNEILDGFNLVSEDGWIDAVAAADRYLVETDVLAGSGSRPGDTELIDRRHKIYRAAVAELASAAEQRELRRAVAAANVDAAVVDLRLGDRPGTGA